MTVPVIDGVDHNTFEYHAVYQEGHHFRGVFEWGMLYKENELPSRESDSRTHNSEPYKYVLQETTALSIVYQQYHQHSKYLENISLLVFA